MGEIVLKKLLLLTILLSFSVCTAGENLVSYKKVLSDPLISYRKGHYRNVVEILEKTPSKANNLELQYIWASSYLELREYEKAFQKFYLIDANELSQSKEYNYIFPFYVRKYLQTLIELDNPEILTPEEELKILDMVVLVPKNSPIRSYMDKELFSVLWSSKNYTAMLSLEKNLSSQGQAWVELAKQQLGQKYNVQAVINNQKEFIKSLAYTNILDELYPNNYRNKKDLDNLVEMNLRVKTYRDKALLFAQRYENLFKDKEYYIKILSRKALLDGDRNLSATLLYDYIIQNPKSSLDFYVYAYEYMISRKKSDLADIVATQAFKYYNKKFYQEAKNGIEFHKNPSYILSWYEKNYKNITDNQHLQVFRALIRVDMEKAEKAVDLVMTIKTKDPQIILMHGLIKEHFGKTEEAYKDYLKLIFQDAFGYAGIVAKNKEKMMRDKYRDHFDKVVKDIVTQIPSYKLKDRLMLYKSFLIDDELSQYVDHRKLDKDQKEFNKIVYADLENVPDIPALENYPKALSNLAPETQDYVENAVSDAMKNDTNWHNTARYYYKYRDLFINSDTEGYLTFRLYFYTRDQFGYTYLPNYPKEIVKLVFPKPEFELITEWIDNDEELAYWMLSSFMAESHFRKRVYSQVGAVGFAQVMPYTAKDIKRWLKKPYLLNYDFYDNMQMGIYYHKRMYDMMDDNVLLSLAAYNAGPGSVQRWLREYAHIKDDYLFIEAIDYQETRNYVKIINYNHGMYRLLYDNDLY